MKFPRLSRKARLGLFAVAAFGVCSRLWPSAHEDHPDPAAYMSTPQHMDSVVKVLRADFRDESQIALRNPKQHFIYTAPMIGQRYSLYSEKNEERKNEIINRYNLAAKKNKKAAYQNLVCDVIALCEGASSGAYKDTEGNVTIAHGILLTKPGHDRPREKLIEKTLRISYKNLYNGKTKLSARQCRQLTLAFAGTFEKQLESASAKAMGNNKKAANNIDPVQRAFVISMLYQAPNLLRRDAVLSDPLLRVMCSKQATDEEKNQAFVKLTEFYAASVALRYGSDKKRENSNGLLYSQRASMIAGDRVSADLIAMQIHSACSDQDDATIGSVSV